MVSPQPSFFQLSCYVAKLCVTPMCNAKASKLLPAVLKLMSAKNEEYKSICQTRPEKVSKSARARGGEKNADAVPKVESTTTEKADVAEGDQANPGLEVAELPGSPTAQGSPSKRRRLGDD